MHMSICHHPFLPIGVVGTNVSWQSDRWIVLSVISASGRTRKECGLLEDTCIVKIHFWQYFSLFLCCPSQQ